MMLSQLETDISNIFINTYKFKKIYPFYFLDKYEV